MLVQKSVSTKIFSATDSRMVLLELQSLRKIILFFNFSKHLRGRSSPCVFFSLVFLSHACAAMVDGNDDPDPLSRTWARLVNQSEIAPEFT
jgi:hypothetical protein